jgi:N6-adenosine-specific RNA methylase IME4
LPVPQENARPHSVVGSPRGKHSEKPERFYEIIEAMYPEYPRVELFSRNVREGWAAWGNQALAA